MLFPNISKIDDFLNCGDPEETCNEADKDWIESCIQDQYLVTLSHLRRKALMFVLCEMRVML